MARRNTAERAGRLSLNPFVHADLIGTWILPISAFVFGRRFSRLGQAGSGHRAQSETSKAGYVLVALAGRLPIFFWHGSTVGVGISLRLRRQGGTSERWSNAQTFIMVNMFLAVFNLIPVHPLDGASEFEPFLPIRCNMMAETQSERSLLGLLVFMLMAARIRCGDDRTQFY